MSSKRLGSPIARCALVAAVLAALPTMALGQPAEDFFKTATLSLYVGSGGGGGYDAIARLVARHMSRYLPGNPNFVIKNMPTAAGVASANFIYNSAPKDGSAILLGTGQWLTPDAQPIKGKGIQPDLPVRLAAQGDVLTPNRERLLSSEQLQASSDAQLLSALKYLSDHPEVRTDRPSA